MSSKPDEFEKEFEIMVKVPCRHCKGSGKSEKGRACKKCHGAGKIQREQPFPELVRRIMVEFKRGGF